MNLFFVTLYTATEVIGQQTMFFERNTSVFVNKVLLKHSHVHSFIHLWLLKVCLKLRRGSVHVVLLVLQVSRRLKFLQQPSWDNASAPTLLQRVGMDEIMSERPPRTPVR